MTNYEQRVNDIIERLETETPVVSDTPIQREDYDNEGFDEYDDGDIVDVEFGTSPNDILSDSPEDLGRVLSVFFKRIYGKEEYKKHAGYITDTVYHEWQHGKVMHDVGVDEVRYGLEIYRNYKPHVIAGKTIYVANWEALPHTTTAEPFTLEKVLYAMIFAYPSQPSGGDLQSVNEIGYKDPRDVYERLLSVQGIPHIKPLSL